MRYTLSGGKASKAKEVACMLWEIITSIAISQLAIKSAIGAITIVMFH